VLLLAALAGALLLPNLGGTRLWADEGDTAVFARTIGERGLPYAWDGRTFTESDRGQRLNADLLMVSTPWLPYYLAALSFAVLGESSLAARLPFALCGIASVALLYLLVLEVTRERRGALAAALLLLASVQFLLYSRQCRYYSLAILLCLVALLGFVRLRERPRDPVFGIASLLLLHTHPLPAAAVLAGTSGLAVAHPSFRATLRPLVAWLALLALLTLPWVWVAWTGWGESRNLDGVARELPFRLGQLGIEMAEVVPVLGWLALAVAARRRLEAADRDWLALCLAPLAAVAALLVLSVSAHDLWVLGVRYGLIALPLAAGVTGVLAARASGGSGWRLTSLLALFAATHLPGASLLYVLASEPGREHPRVIVARPQGALGPWLRLEWLGYAGELWRSNPGTVSRVAEYLAAHARPDDIVITNYSWEPLYFHTNLRQGLKILPDYPIREAARAKGLPDYVFQAAGARWVVWRHPWEGYQGYRLGLVRGELERSGARLLPVAVVPETIWENRPELHFHRFPGRGHLYPGNLRRAGYGSVPMASIFRVEGGSSQEPRPGG
jgi:4-amino-4-deoxy-L-arabinose transferase-like glycosyltransferase